MGDKGNDHRPSCAAHGRHERCSALVLTALAVAGLTAGCGSSDRPRELPFDDVRPCELISSPKLHDLGVKAAPSPISVVPGADEEGTTCQYRPKSGGTITVSVVTNHGIDRWTGGSSEFSTAIDLPRIQGYRTIQKAYKSDSPSDAHDKCTLYLDVASGQSLRAQTGSNQDDDPPTCEIARDFADAAVTSLKEQTS